jgi:hypothetical protein
VCRFAHENPELLSMLQQGPAGIPGLLAPLGDFGPSVRTFFETVSREAYFVHYEYQGVPDGRGQLFVVLPIEVGFVSVALRSVVGSKAEERILGLPEFLRGTSRLATMVGIHLRSEYLDIPDVRWLRGIESEAYVATSIRQNLRGVAGAHFGDGWQDNLLEVTDAENLPWSVFADFREGGDGDLWLSLQADYSDVRRLARPRPAYEAMLTHYLFRGATVSFDFRHYAESASIW